MSAEDYDKGQDWLYKSFGANEFAIRREMAKLVYGKVLEVGCGTGRDSAHLWLHCDSLTITDVDPELLAFASKKVPAAESMVCDVHELPFPAETFDCVFHFGALNTFRFPCEAVCEMNRVVKFGGKVIMGDEGLAPWLLDKKYGRMLIKANPLYLNQPPLDLLPFTAEEVRVRWILGNAFYLIEYVKGEAPKLDEDIPILGPRGGTLRSRFA